MTLDEFNTFIASVEASFSPTLEELKQAVRAAGAAHARQLKADMAKPRESGIYTANVAGGYYGPETTRQAYDRCVSALRARVEGEGRTANVASFHAPPCYANAHGGSAIAGHQSNTGPQATNRGGEA